VRTLDSFLGQPALHAPDLIKADVQGFELEVLRGATKCLETAKLLLLEVSYRRIYENLTLAHEVIGYVGRRGVPHLRHLHLRRATARRRAHPVRHPVRARGFAAVRQRGLVLSRLAGR
jgi:hypothetical protein